MDTAPNIDELKTWILIFNPVSKSRLANWLSFGKFKHVSAIAYVTGLKLWVTYDVSFGGTKIAVLPDGNATTAILSDWLGGCTLVRMIRKERKYLLPPLFGWCVPSGPPALSLTPTPISRDTGR